MSSSVEPQSQTVEDIDNNIVKIIDNNGNFNGTGFFIKVDEQNYCITCHHCIYKLDEIFIQRYSVKSIAQWMEEYSDPAKDIAVFKVDNSAFKPLLYAKEAMPNFPVSIRGFSGKKLKSLPEGTSRSSDLSDSWKPFEVEPKEFVGRNKWNTKPKVYVNVYECEGKFEFGFSGGPVCYKGPNKVIGAFTAKDDDYGYVIPIQTILEKFQGKGSKELKLLKEGSVAEFNHITKSYQTIGNKEHGYTQYDRKFTPRLIFQGAQIFNVDLSCIDLDEADLCFSLIRKINFSYARFRWANLAAVNAEEAIFYKADLRNTYLSRIILSKADLSYADLSEAILLEPTLKGTNLRNAVLCNSVLVGCTQYNNLECLNADFNNAIIDRQMLVEYLRKKKAKNVPDAVNTNEELQLKLQEKEYVKDSRIYSKIMERSFFNE